MSNEKLADLLRDCLSDYSHPNFTDRYGMADRIRGALQAHAAEAVQAQAQTAEPVGEVVGVTGSVGEMRVIRWRGRYSPEVGTKLYTHPQPAQDAFDPERNVRPGDIGTEPTQDAKDAAAPLKGWIFDKVDMGRGDERYICTPDGSNATTVRNETTSDHRERMLWLIADAMAKESGR